MSTQSKKTTKTGGRRGRPQKPELRDGVQVHWVLPRALLRKLKHHAIDKDLSTVELARKYLKYGVDRLK